MSAGDPREHALEVVRTARYCTLGRPAPESGEVWFVLHGYRQLARRFLKRFGILDDGTRRVVAPEGLSRFYLGRGGKRHGPSDAVGASWMTREDRESEIRDYLGYLDRLAERELAGSEVPVVVLGFSQGAHTAARWVVGGGVRPRRLILWGAGLPRDLDPAEGRRRLGSLEVVLVRGEDDPNRDRDAERAEEARIEAWGVRPRIRGHPGGHDIDPDLLSRLAEPPISRSAEPPSEAGPS